MIKSSNPSTSVTFPPNPSSSASYLLLVMVSESALWMEVRGKNVGTFKSPALARGIFDIYLGNKVRVRERREREKEGGYKACW